MAQKRAVSIGGVVFGHKMYMLELDEPSNIVSEVAISEAGTHIVWQSEILTPYITLESREQGWIEQAEKDLIMELYSQFEATFVLVFDDESEENVRFAHEKGIPFTPISEGSSIYTAQISLAVVLL